MIPECDGCPCWRQDEFDVWHCGRPEKCPLPIRNGELPHKCPVCWGFGKIQDPAPVGIAINTIDCPACGGTGVLWR